MCKYSGLKGKKYRNGEEEMEVDGKDEHERKGT